MMARFRKHIPAVVLALVFFSSHLVQASEDPVIRADQAKDYFKQVAMVCGLVVEAHYAQTVNGRPTYLNFEEEYPNAVFTAIIWEKEREDFPYSPEALEGLNVCVYGKITRYRGKPQMKLVRPEQVGVKK